MAVRDWSLYWDRDDDGVLTTGDALLWLQSVFYYPGDMVLWLCDTLSLTPLVRWIEPSPHYYGGMLAAVLSGLVWLAVAMRLGKIGKS